MPGHLASDPGKGREVSKLEQLLRDLTEELWQKKCDGPESFQLEWVDLNDLARDAARISAEIERDECALIAEDRACDRASDVESAMRHGRRRDAQMIQPAQSECIAIADAIRARGAK